MKILSLETLADFDGGSAGVLCNQAIRAAYFDLRDRPRLKKKRTIHIVIELEPEQSEDDLEAIKATVIIKSTMPDKASRSNILSPQAQGMGFEPDTRIAKFAAGQSVLPEMAEEEGDE